MDMDNWFFIEMGVTDRGLIAQIGLDEDFKRIALSNELSIDQTIVAAMLTFLLDFCDEKSIDFNETLKTVLTRSTLVTEDCSVADSLSNMLKIRNTIEELDLRADS